MWPQTAGIAGFMVARETARPGGFGHGMTIPAGFEHFVTELGRSARHGLPPPSSPDVERLAAAAARHGNEIVGPPLRLVKKAP
jgi:hypothetical protein